MVVLVLFLAHQPLDVRGNVGRVIFECEGETIVGRSIIVLYLLPSHLSKNGLNYTMAPNRTFGAS